MDVLIDKEIIAECIWRLMRPTGFTNDDLSIVKSLLAQTIEVDPPESPTELRHSYCFDNEVDPKKIDNNKHYILEILDILIESEKRKVVGLGANITSLLGSNLEDLRERILSK